MSDNNTAVVISSCDKYSFIWSIYHQIFMKYWSDCPYPIYFITNEKDAALGQTIQVGNTDWATGMTYALKSIKEKTIIFLLEDYWFTESVNTVELDKLCQFMNNTACDHIRLYVSEGSQKILRKSFTPELNLLNQDEDYRCSLNAGIWNKQIMLDLLELENNIWNSEHIMTEKSRSKLFCTVKEMKYIVYEINENMIEQGKITKAGYDYLKKQGINFC